nr:EOG090X09QP [Sida crystallina]
MSVGLRRISRLSASCPIPARLTNVQVSDSSINRLYGTTQVANLVQSNIITFADPPKALAIPAQSDSRQKSLAESRPLLDSDEVCNLLDARHYAVLSLTHHLRAQQFLKDHTGNHDHLALAVSSPLNNVPKLRQTLRSIDVNPDAFMVYFDGQLSSQERNLLMKSTRIQSNKEENRGNYPSPLQLEHVANVLGQSLPQLFIQPMDYKIYAPDIVFDNRIRGKCTKGIYSYVQQVALLRCIGHIKFAYVRFDVLKITQHPEEGTVKVRWRITGISGLKIFLNFWRYKLWQWKDLMAKQESWYDGFSTFHVSSDGLVHLHIADKMMPDDDKVTDSKSPIAAKLAVLLGLIGPKSNWNDMADMAPDGLFFSLDKDVP